MTPKKFREAEQAIFAERGSLPALIVELRRGNSLVARTRRTCERLALELATMRELGVTARRQLADEERQAMKTDAEIRALMFPVGQETQP